MNKEKWVFFDFDGTITESSSDILQFFNTYITGKYTSKKLYPEDWERLKGMNISEKVAFAGIPFYKLPFAIRRCQKRFPEILEEFNIYPGLKEACIELKRGGVRLGIVSTNRRKNIEGFLNNNNLNDIFDRVVCDRGPFLFIKHHTIKRLMQKMQISSDSIIYVGDESRDIKACRKIGIPVISVSWGWETEKLLKLADPDRLINKPSELSKAVSSLWEK